jgi:flagellar L-ring protein precursor FlgH
VIVIAAAACTAEAGSIWARGEKQTQVLYADDTAAQVGDVLTIIIEEKSKIENDTTRSLEKGTSRTGNMGGTLDLANVLGPVGEHIFDFPKLDFSSSSDTEFEGDAGYETDRTMADRITVAVHDVLPNGNLVVVGSRSRFVDGDTQIIEISGVVRPSDIAFNNTVSSSRVADFRVVARTEGRENRFTKPGWLGRFLNVVNPF